MDFRFNPKRLVDIDEVTHQHVCTITLSDDVGAKVIAGSTVKHFRLIGVIDDDDAVFCYKQGNVLTITIEVPLFNVHGLLGEN